VPVIDMDAMASKYADPKFWSSSFEEPNDPE
jgi:hypothetical protein